MWRDLPSRQLLVLGFLLAGVLPVMLVALLAYSGSQEALRHQAMQRLELARNIKRAQVERFFAERRSNAQVFASDPYLVSARRELCAAYAEATRAAETALVGRDRGDFEAPSSYLEVHARHHPFLRRFTAKHGFYDLLLVDTVSGHVCYSVQKERDFAAPTAAQPLLHEVVREATAGSAVLSDTQPYPPSANAAAQFIAVPIYEGLQIAGVLVLQVSIEAIDAIMRERSGMGETGETLLVGPDFKMRSDSALDQARTVEASFRGTVTDNGFDTATARWALTGESGLGESQDPRHRPVLSAWTPVELGGPRWALVAMIEQTEIEAQIAAALNPKILWALAVALALGLCLAFAVSALIRRGIGSISVQVARLVARVDQGHFNARADLHDVSVDYRDVLAQVNGLVASVEKVTADKARLEEQIARVQRLEALGTLAGGIAHDFNNNLSYMHACVDIVRGLVPADGLVGSHLEKLVVAMGRASDQVNRVLTFSRQGTQRPRAINLVDPVHEATQLVGAAIPKQLTLVLTLGDRPLPVHADPSAIHQVVLNLMTNAIYAMRGRTGTLTVQLQEQAIDTSIVALRAGRYVRLRVHDTGVGMDPSTLAHVFEPYFTTKPVGEGTGMGLALVHGIVTSAGGAVLVESAPGKGACFDVYWPWHDGHSAT